MRLRRTGRIGLVMIAVSLVTLVCWTAWFHTRTWCPVNMPVSLSQGSHFTTGEFASNLNAEYEIEVESEGRIPLETLECLLGSEYPAEKCHIASVIRVRWTLYGNGTVVQGMSDDTAAGYGGSGPSGEAFRTIGFFKAQKGRRYKVDFDVLADGSRLAVTNPHLRISALNSSFESGLVLNGLLRLVCVAAGLLGMILLVISLLVQRRGSRSIVAKTGP